MHYSFCHSRVGLEPSNKIELLRLDCRVRSLIFLEVTNAKLLDCRVESNDSSRNDEVKGVIPTKAGTQ